jgi:hypothetical protein
LEDLADIGIKGAVNRQLEIWLGHRKDGPVVLTERGPGITAVVAVLEDYLAQLSQSVILKKWLDDLLASAALAFQTVGCPVSECGITSSFRLA